MSASAKNIAILAALILVAVLAWRRYGSRLSSVLPG